MFDEQAICGTLLPFTTKPLALVFMSQPTPEPWSARQIQV